MPLKTVIASPLKNLELIVDSNKNKLIGLYYTNKSISPVPKDPFTKNICQQLTNYFENSKFKFDIPMEFNGSEHQTKLWLALTKIPLGQTKTYGELAKELNSCAQAIGNACRSNPISIIVPCHRVVAKNGFGGYSGKTAGQMLKIKLWLLEHEKS